MLVDFFKFILELKNIKRKGWIDKLDIKNPESVADHSYSLAFMSIILSELQGLDSNRVVKMALLHDLAESQIGDFTPNEISKEKKLELENNEMKKILKNLPKELIKEYQTIWDDFLMNTSNEALFVHEMDKFEMVFQAKTYMNRGISKEKIQPFIDSANIEIKNKQLKEIVAKFFN